MILSGMCTAVVITMFISHRIAGPVFRIRAALQEMSEGRILRKITLRRRVEFKERAETVSSLIKKFEDLSGRNRKAKRKVKDRIKRFFSGPGSAEEIGPGPGEIGFFEKERARKNPPAG